MGLHFESKSDSFVACVHLICQPLSFVVGTSGRINHNIIKAHDLVTQFVLCVSQPMELFSSNFFICQFLAVSYFYYHQLFNLSHASHSYETKFRRIKKEEKYSLTLILHIILCNIHNWCVDVHILKSEKELSLSKKLESGYEKVDVKIINTLQKCSHSQSVRIPQKNENWNELFRLKVDINKYMWNCHYLPKI